MAIDASFAAQVRKALADQVPDIAPAADAARVGGLGVALALQAAQQVSLTLNRGRSAAKFGPASPQVEALDARLSAGAQLTQALHGAWVRTQWQAPTVPEGSAAVFGGVVNAAGAGIARATVVAFNAAGAETAKTASAADGSYGLVVPVPANAQTGLAPPAGAASPTVTVRLEVLVGGRVAGNSSQTLTLLAGETVMRDLVVTAAKAPSAPTTAQRRAPGTGKKLK